jgi:hypothetical protein
MKIKLQNTITRQEFESGVPFVFYYDNEGPFKFIEDDNVKYLKRVNPVNEYSYYCPVKKITDDGFTFHNIFFGVSVKGKVLFEECIKMKN